MADDTLLGAAVGTGDTISTDDLGTKKVQRMKVQFGADGSATDVASGNPLPVSNSATTNAGATAKTSDYDTGAGTDTVTSFGIALPASGGAVQGGTSTNPVRTDPTGTTTQPVSGTVTATGPLTDTQLRASAVPVSGTVTATGPLTDTQLRASAPAVDTELPAAAALADGASNPTAPATGSFGLLWNGATWDRIPGSAAGGLTANLKQLNGTTVDTNSGVKSAGTLRTVLATDQPALTNALKVDPSAVTSPVSLASLPALATGGNLIGRVNVEPETTGGLSVFHLVSAATTNATNLKAAPGQVYGWYIYNSNTVARKVAFHNTAGSPTAGASIFFAIVLPPTSAANVEFTTGIAFGTGIAITTVTDLTDAGATAVGLNDLIINIFFK